jgi:hypothetical protein
LIYDVTSSSFFFLACAFTHPPKRDVAVTPTLPFFFLAVFPRAFAVEIFSFQ